ncbi:MAG: hypothetical protein Q8N00_07485 [Nitrospirota bacterium]|nr:hypothetical protein [Nitrospirota bacterium]MDP3513321.1 hypothetical protein [Sulfuritalea sp.]
MIDLNILRRWCSHLVARVSLARLEKARAYARQRVSAENMLAEFSHGQEADFFFGTVLVDGTWDNPNHWARYALLRRALGLSRAREIGLVGPFRSKECSQTFTRLGIKEIVSFDVSRKAQDCQDVARGLLSNVKSPRDILSWKLPHGFPPEFLYDGLLKRQRAACVNLADPRLLGYVSELLGCLAVAEHLLKTYDFKLLVMSHVINFQYAALAWMAVVRGIPVVASYGEFGVLRFVKINRPEEMWEATNRPTKFDFEHLSPECVASMATAGRAYIQKRRVGNTKELAAIYSYQKRQQLISRQDICAQFEWDPKRPIIAVYASNWFDYPHMYGMSHFVDFLDWLKATIDAANMNQSVNWLFKAHPCDDWYGGVTLSDLMPAHLLGHIQQVPKEWNGAALMDAVDGLVTYHGTAGIEFAAVGKPVLIADKGWYHELGIAKWPRSREEYLQSLATEWWKDVDISETSRRAQILAGWHFCRPSWQGGFILEDDPVQSPIYETLPDLWSKNQEVIARELRTIRDWVASPHRHYHTYKMGLAKEFSA